jgi:hypothetical protein
MALSRTGLGAARVLMKDGAKGGTCRDSNTAEWKKTPHGFSCSSDNYTISPGARGVNAFHLGVSLHVPRCWHGLQLSLQVRVRMRWLAQEPRLPALSLQNGIEMQSCVTLALLVSGLSSWWVPAVGWLRALG